MRAQVTDFAQNDPTYCMMTAVQAVPLPDKSIPPGVLTATEQKKTEQLLQKYPPFLNSWTFVREGQQHFTMHYFLMDSLGAVSISCYPQEEVFAPENALLRQGVVHEITNKVLPAVQAQMNTTQPALLDAWGWVSTNTRTEDVASLKIKQHKFQYVYALVPSPSASILVYPEKPKNFEESLGRQRLRDWKDRSLVQQKFWEDLGFFKGQSKCDAEACITAFWYPSVSKAHDF